LAILAFFFVDPGLGAAPRWFAPVVLRPGSVNEVYAWDEAPVGPFRVEVRRPGAQEAFAGATGFAVDRPLSVLGQGNRPLKWSAALVCPDASEEPGPVTVRFLGAGGKVLSEVASEIAPRSFPSEDIPLDKDMSRLREKPDPRKDREAQAIWAVYLKFEGRFPWTGTRFLLPVDPSFPTSAQFGDVRHYRYADGTTAQDYHTGVDFAVPVGTPVRAPAPGKVVLAADRMLTGTTLVLEHAPGVYSVYFHLSRALVTVGRSVQAGDRLALSGASGLVTGPHLHWEIRAGGVPVDPLDFTTDGLLDTKAVGAVVSSVERLIH
jgi:murein DD-endopeptidase MepM/ murein hydrolase activator NlpD